MLPSALITDLAEALIGDRPIEIEWPGIRPGEKIHEILVSEEEAQRTFRRGERQPGHPAAASRSCAAEQVDAEPFGEREYSSGKDPLDREAASRAASARTG